VEKNCEIRSCGGIEIRKLQINLSLNGLLLISFRIGLEISLVSRRGIRFSVAIFDMKY